MRFKDIKGVSRPEIWRYLWFSAATVALALFIRITHELREQELDWFDDLLLRSFVRIRVSWLTVAAKDITTLGSFAFTAAVSTIATTTLWLVRNRPAALQVLVSLAGATMWVHLLKNVIQRVRPNGFSPLVQASGFSYPSGHSLTAAAVYLTLAIVYQRSIKARVWRIIGTVIALLIINLVGLSRVYLGVHYPSDVASGILFGTGWALFVAAWFAARDRRPVHRCGLSRGEPVNLA